MVAGAVETHSEAHLYSNSLMASGALFIISYQNSPELRKTQVYVTLLFSFAFKQETERSLSSSHHSGRENIQNSTVFFFQQPQATVTYLSILSANRSRARLKHPLL